MGSRRSGPFSMFLVGGFALVFSSKLAAQCQMCRTALTNSAEGQRWAQGINAGILLLLAAPFLIVGTIIFFIYRPQIVAALSTVRLRCWEAMRRSRRHVQQTLAAVVRAP